jgi:hypothetical protein
MSGVVTVILILLIIMTFRNRRKSEMVQVSSAFPITDIRVRETKSESPTLVHTSNKNLDGISEVRKVPAVVHGSKLSVDGSSKVLLSWLESLPTAQQNITNQDLLNPDQSNKNHPNQFNTLTKSHHRHKMLTNVSFATLRETPSGSDCGSTQLTTSTLDESHSSDSRTECYNYYTESGGVRRSNTSATLARGSSNTGYFSFKDYGAATLGRMPRGSERVRQGVGERMYRSGWSYLPLVKLISITLLDQGGG